MMRTCFACAAGLWLAVVSGATLPARAGYDWALPAGVRPPHVPADIDHYADGGRTIAGGPNRGIGHDNPNKSEAVRGFWLVPQQRADLMAFLESLTDEALLRDPRFANPWTPTCSPMSGGGTSTD